MNNINNYYKKRKLKDYLAKNKWIIIGTGSFLTTGLIVMLIGFAISGWSLIKWLQSPFALTFFIMLVLGLFAIAMLIYFYHIFVNKR